MKRIDRIYLYIKEKTVQLVMDSKVIDVSMGMTTVEISEALKIQRSNVSKDLNELVRQGKLVKLAGRPVKYVSQKAFHHQPLTKPVKSYKENNLKESTNASSMLPLKSETVKADIFKQMIGSMGSMKTSVEQAKAAIMYPPKGLNCLITGATGSGKTYFAHAMFQFASLKQIVAKDKELIVFNCADYAHNPELLMSHLFGYAEGAFTGATKAKEGLIHEADGSFLFLDEIHRLPPEGQEMIFYFMDHGTYSRLGETAKTRCSNVRMICATTENQASSLLQTFVRRIPMIIQLPNFSDRPATEKIDLLKVMVSMEATRIQRKISLSEDVVKALIGSVSYGNVGQLKSNVQLVTARGFLKYIEQDEISITMDELTETLKEGLLQLANDRLELSELAKYSSPKMTILPNESLVSIHSDAYELPYNLYEIIGDKAALLKADGVEQEAINHFITTDINLHLQSFYKNHGFTFNAENRLAEIVDPQMIEVTKELYQFAKNTLMYPFQSNFIYAMSLHISSFLKRIQMGEARTQLPNENIRNMVLDYPNEFNTAKKMKKIIERTYQQSIPDSEIYYLAVLMISLKETNVTGRIGVVVAANGESTASSMVKVVSHLLNVDNIRAVDMPLDMRPKEAMYRIIDEVEKSNEGSGVILLVDMGSLATFSEEIYRRTGIAVRTIDMVTTSLVLETARKTTLIDTQLDLLYESLKQFRGYASTQMTNETLSGTNEKLPVIVAICASGEGTAVQMKELIETALPAPLDLELTVLPISVVEVEQKLIEIQSKYRLIAVTGVLDPKIDVPFISLETFISGDILMIVEGLLNSSDDTVHLPKLNIDTAKQICIDYMKQSFTFINPAKMIEPLWTYALNLQKEYFISLNENTIIALVMHVAGVIERILRQDILTAEKKELSLLLSSDIYVAVQKANQELENILCLKIPIQESYYIVQFLLNVFQTGTDTLKDTQEVIH